MDGKRTEAFSDGVFAVAITLLALELKPVPGDGTLLHRLGEAWPSYLAYVVSFLTIGIMWLNHHTMFRHIIRVDRALLMLNLALLMIVAAVPFPTALLGEELRHLHSADAKTAAVVYGLVMIAMAIAFTALWWYATARGRLDESLPEHAVRKSMPRFGLGFLGYLLATGVSFFSPLAGLVMYGLLAFYYAFEHLPGQRDADEGA